MLFVVGEEDRRVGALGNEPMYTIAVGEQGVDQQSRIDGVTGGFTLALTMPERYRLPLPSG